MVEDNNLDKAIADAKAAIHARSYSKRHLELGRMVNCAVCGNRHREAQVCRQVFAKYEDGSPRMAEGAGKWQFAKKRFRPHPNKRGLQLVQLTQQMYPDYELFLADPVDCMKMARTDAQRILKKRRKAESKKKRGQHRAARKINFGL